jgi:hypothetical protein
MAALASPLVTCPLDILAMITSKIDTESMLRLYSTDKTGLRPRLTQYGGVRSISFHKSSLLPPWSFPVFACRFQRLTTLKVISDYRLVRTFMIGTMLHLPQSLTHLEFKFEYAMTCWLQPSGHEGNNDEGPFPEKFKPIFLDRLLPNLVSLSLQGSNSSEIFCPQPPVVVTSMPGAYFDPPSMSILSPQMQAEISSHFALKMSMKWTPEMRVQWINHLPRSTLAHFQVGSMPIGRDFFSLLPPNLSSLDLLSGSYPLNRMSLLPDSLKQSLTSLAMPIEEDNLDASFPPHLTEISITTSYMKLPDGIFHYLPSELRKLTFNSYSNQTTIPSIPQSLTILHLGHAPIDLVAPMLPIKLHTFTITLRQMSSIAGLKLLPDGLQVLRLLGDWTPTSDSIAALPRGLVQLHIEGSPGSMRQEDLLLLPPELVHLHLSQCCSEMGDEAIKLLPRSLTHFFLYSNRFSNEIAKDLPPNLTHLGIDNAHRITEEIFLILPKSVTSLKVASLIVNGALLQEGPTEINTKVTKETVCQHMTPEMAELKRNSENIRYRDPLYFHYGQLERVPNSAISVDYPGDNCGPWWCSPKPNLTSLSLPENTSFSPSKFKCLSSLTYLSLPNNIQMKGNWSWFPPHLTYLDISSTILTVPEHPPMDSGIPPAFPPGLTTLYVSSMDPSVYHCLSTLYYLTSFKMASCWNQKGQILPFLPPSLTYLEIRSAVQMEDLGGKMLPPKLVKLITPDSKFTDSTILTLPRTLEVFHCQSFSIHTRHFYDQCPPMESFTSPSSLLDILKSPRKGESGPFLPPKLDTFHVSTWYINLDNHFAEFLPKDLKTFMTTINHTLLSNQFIEMLPRTLTSLDMGKQTTGFTSECVPLLPPGLLSLVLHASEFTEPGVFGSFPRGITDLELLRAPGRLTVAKAKELPPNLTRLKLGICIVGDDALPHIPRSLTSLDISNAPFITDAGAGELPRNLTRLWLPTCRLSPACILRLPPLLVSLCLGSGCSVPAPFVLAQLQDMREAFQRAQTDVPNSTTAKM